MKAHLMYKDRDFDLQKELPVNEEELIQDLELNTLFNAMALGDEFLLEVVKKAVLTSLNDPDEIRYRQDILKDCIKNPSTVREIYSIPLESIKNKRKRWLGIFSRYPGAILDSSIRMLSMFVELLKKLRHIADENADNFKSEGFRTFFSMIKKELDDKYFSVVEAHLKRLNFPDGVLVSAELGRGNEGTNYVLRKPNEKNGSWIKRIISPKQLSYSFYISPRDEHGAEALSELRDRGINSVANALAQSADHIDSFFEMLKVELAFYMGSLNLYEQLNQISAPVSFPVPLIPGKGKLSFKQLCDPSFALTVKHKVVGNNLEEASIRLMIITGANQGGKSTFLRSIGSAQLMMQCGMFTAAEAFSAEICSGLFTHYKREEDTAMESGKLDEELKRMSTIVDNLRPDSIVLFNESFAATNEREGSEIAGQIVNALLEKNVKVFFVTHLYAFANEFAEKEHSNNLFLRAQRKPDGVRTFKLIKGEPLQTSYGEDLYQGIFKAEKRV